MIDSQEFMTNVAIGVVEDSIKGAWDKVKKFFKDLDAKDSIRYKTAYEKYLLNTKLFLKSMVKINIFYLQDRQKNL